MGIPMKEKRSNLRDRRCISGALEIKVTSVISTAAAKRRAKSNAKRHHNVPMGWRVMKFLSVSWATLQNTMNAARGSANSTDMPAHIFHGRVDGSVDCVICQDVLDHFLMPETVVHECYRVLRPGGMLAVSVDVVGVSKVRGPLEDLMWMLRHKGAFTVARGAWWRVKGMVSAVNRHGHIHHFTRADVDQLLDIFTEHGYAAPETPGFEGKTFIWAKKG